MKLKGQLRILLSIPIFFIIIGVIHYFHYSSRPRTSNVILITVDALRSDHLGCYGYKRNTSPHIDRLAKEGVLFTQVISQGPNTFISLPSMLTSTSPHVNGVFYCGDEINTASKTLAEILKFHHYSTAFISGYSLLAKIGGLNRGFDMFKCEFPLEKGQIHKYCAINDARKITHLANKWVAGKKNRPSFLWIHYFEVHGFYKNLPMAYKKMFMFDDLYKGGKNVPISDDVNNVYRGSHYIPYYLSEAGITDLSYYIAQYDGAIRYVDEHIGILLAKLKELNLYNNTLLIITADHGESLGEHDFYLDHDSLYDEVIKIPLIIKLGDASPKRAIVEAQVQSMDIIPTLLEILKIEVPDTMQGMSFLPLILGGGDKHSEYALSTHDEATSVRTEGWKLIHNVRTGRYELYNLNNDPGELSNLVSTEKYTFELLGHTLDTYEHENLLNKKAKPTIDKETKEKLKSLGYAQ